MKTLLIFNIKTFIKKKKLKLLFTHKTSIPHQIFESYSVFIWSGAPKIKYIITYNHRSTHVLQCFKNVQRRRRNNKFVNRRTASDLAMFQNKVVKCHSHEFFPRVTHMIDLRANLVTHLIQSLILCKQNAVHHLGCLDSEMRIKKWCNTLCHLVSLKMCESASVVHKYLRVLFTYLTFLATKW